MNKKICNRCVMDNESDDSIVFDENGICNYCTSSLNLQKERNYYPSAKANELLDSILKEIKEKSKNKKYDCLMGISGGLDSSYLAYLGAAKWKLRILAVHIDDGFDTEISTNNIKKLIEKLNIQMITIKPDFEQYYALIKAYLKAGVGNIAVPQDNILFAAIYKFAKKNKIKYFLSGSNFALESILQKQHLFPAFDVKNIKSINKKFGTTKINKLPFLSFYRKYFDLKIHHLKTFAPLNYVKYERELALKELNDYCGFEYYGSKHLENYFTAFTQLYWYPKKFNVDKRKSHFSSMIISNQMSRENALNLLKDSFEDKVIEKSISIVKEKLNITEEEYKFIMDNKTHENTEYKYDKLVCYLLKKRNKNDK